MDDAAIISAVVIAIVAYVYFTIVRPARKDQARHRQHMRDLRPGDEVLTTSNFIARVTDIQVQESGPTRILLEIADGVVVTALPGAIIERVAVAEGSPADAAPLAADPSSTSGRAEGPLQSAKTAGRPDTHPEQPGAASTGSGQAASTGSGQAASTGSGQASA